MSLEMSISKVSLPSSFMRAVRISARMDDRRMGFWISSSRSQPAIGTAFPLILRHC